MRGTRNLLWLLPLASLAAAPLWWPKAVAFLRPRGDFGLAAPVTEEQPRTFTMQQVILSQSRGGVEELEIVARRVTTPQGESHLEMEEVQAVIFDRQKKPTRITGGQASYDSDAQALIIRDHVIVSSTSGYEMTTDSLEYQSSARRIATRDAVAIVGPAINVKGQGLRYDLDSGDFQVDGRVRVNLH
jgi:LPS export ABC transporter protein LptC